MNYDRGRVQVTGEGMTRWGGGGDRGEGLRWAGWGGGIAGDRGWSTPRSDRWPPRVAALYHVTLNHPVIHIDVLLFVLPSSLGSSFRIFQKQRLLIFSNGKLVVPVFQGRFRTFDFDCSLVTRKYPIVPYFEFLRKFLQGALFSVCERSRCTHPHSLKELNLESKNPSAIVVCNSGDAVCVFNNSLWLLCQKSTN